MAEDTKPQDTMDAIDAAFAPALRNADRLGTVGFGDLKQLLVGMRQALAHVVYGPPPAGNAHDLAGEQALAAEEVRAQAEREAAGKAGEAPPAGNELFA